jgi:undecaprenyl-diphosphatase
MNPRTIALLASLLMTTVCFSQNWDADAVRSVNPQNPLASFAFTTLSRTAKPLSVAVPAGMLAVSLLEKDPALRNYAWEMAGGLLITAAATSGIKLVANRQRPYRRYTGIYPDQYDDAGSFPSGHASVAFYTAASLSLHYKKWYVVLPSFVWAGAVGYSRVYMGQHYPTDILASAVTGIGSAWLSRWLGKKILR